MHCLNCNASIPDERDFCPHCGMDVIRHAKTRALRSPRLCSSCGQAFSIGASDTLDLCPDCRLRVQAKGLSASEKHRRDRERRSGSERADMASQRKTARFEVPKCLVRVRRLGVTAMLLRRDKTQAGPVLDLSRGGLQCVAAGRFAKGERVDVQLLVPAFSIALSLAGIVRWAREHGQDSTRMGIEFQDVDAKTAAHLQALEKHESLRQAAHLLEMKKASTSTMPAVEPPAQRSDRPADF